MAKKRTSLDSVLPQEVGAVPDSSPKESRSNKPALEKPAGRRPHVKQQALYLKHPIHRQLRMLAFEEECKMHDLCLEALDFLFANRGLPSIGELLDRD